MIKKKKQSYKNKKVPFFSVITVVKNNESKIKKTIDSILSQTFKNFEYMNWEDECYLLSKRKFKENANIINVFSKERGKISGLVYGGNSRKIRNYLQISNKLFVEYNSKNENKIGYFKTELIKPVSPLFFNDKIVPSCILSSPSVFKLISWIPPKNVLTAKIFLNFLFAVPMSVPVSASSAVAPFKGVRV